MTKFEGCYLTDEGLALVNDRGLDNITFTKAVTGSGTYESKEEVPGMTSLKEQKQEFNLEGFSQDEDYTVSIKFKIRNADLEEGYHLSEIGIYAKGNDNEEKLYCVAFAIDGNTEEVPAYDGAVEYIISINVETVVSTDAEITIVNSEEHEYIKEYVEKIVGEINVDQAGTISEQIAQLKNPEFEEAESRENIASGETLSTLFGKIKKWFADLKSGAFASVANNCTTTEEGHVLDARQGRMLQGQVDEINSNMASLESSFRDGCDTIVSGCTTYGAAPSSNSPADIVAAIKNIYTSRYNAGVSATKKGTASAAQVLAGYTFTSADGVEQPGSMTNRGAWKGATTGSGNVTIPAGYHNGSGYVSGSGAYNAGYNAGHSAGLLEGYGYQLLKEFTSTLSSSGSSSVCSFNSGSHSTVIICAVMEYSASQVPTPSIVNNVGTALYSIVKSKIGRSDNVGGMLVSFKVANVSKNTNYNITFNAGATSGTVSCNNAVYVFGV